MEHDDDKLIGFLEDQGAIIWDGQSEDGEAVFRFNLEKLKEVMPELYDEIMADIDKDLMDLYQMGMVEIEYDENLNAMFRITEEAEKLMREVRENPPSL
jgi:Tfp pilus assembly ATPase PilU